MSDLEPSKDILECYRFYKNNGGYRTAEDIARWLNMSPRVKAEIRRRWREIDAALEQNDE